MSTKEKLLEAALHLFAQVGIQQTSTKSISSKAGFAEGTLFRHFPTKQNLIDNLYLQIKKESFGHLKQIIDPYKTKELVFKEVTRHVIDYFLLSHDALVFIEMVDKHPIISEKVKKESLSFMEDLQAFLTKCLQAKIFKSDDLDFNLLVMQGLITSVIQYNTQYKRSKISEKQLQFIWESIAKN